MGVKDTRIDRRTILKHGAALSGAAFAGSVAGCLGGGGGGVGSIAVGSKQFTEQQILGTMSVQCLNANSDAEIVDETELGGTVTNFEALKSGDIDHYWEYTGTAWATLPPKHDEVIADPEELYNKVAQEFQDEYDFELLDRALFNNTYVLVARQGWVEETGVETLSDFASYVKSGNTDFTVVMDAEFADRSDGWPGLIEHYGFADAAEDLNIQHVGPALGYQIVGQEEADVGMGFNTNPKIIKWDLEVLDDDQQFFPVYNPVPMFRAEILEADESIAPPLNTVAGELDTETIRSLNKRVAIDGEKTVDVVETFLTEIGVL